MSASLTHCGLPAGVTRNEFRRSVKTACRHIFKLPSIAIEVIDAYFDRTQDGDFEPGAKCGCWVSAHSLAESLSKSERCINEGEKALVDAGLIERTNGRSSRCGKRGDGIEWFFGISLKPLIERATEILALVAEHRRLAKLQKKAVSVARAEIRELRRHIRKTDDVGAIEAAEEILPRGRTSRIKNLDRLNEILEALEAIVEAIDDASGAQESAHRSAETSAPITISESTSKSCSEVGDAPASMNSVTVRQALTVASPDFLTLYELQSRPGWPGLADAARQMASQHGIAQHSWGTACERWGPQVAALSVVLIDRNSRLPNGHRWQVSTSFGGCFVGLMRNPRNLLRMLSASRQLPDEAFCERPPAMPTGSRESDGRLGDALSALLPKLEVTEAAHDRR